MAKKEEVPQSKFKESIHKCGKHIFISIMGEYDPIIYKLSFNQDRYSSDINYNSTPECKIVDYTHCPYCGTELNKYEL
jgi:hypothetical protein